MVKICDAIMGSGKSSAAIKYMNDHPDEKFIYITPYLGEAERIKKGCPKLSFVEPSNKIAECNWKKMNHTELLVKEGRNIATTHQAFLRYTKELIENIRSQHYTLFIDEDVDMLNALNIKKQDLDILIESGCVALKDRKYSTTQKSYEGSVFTKFFNILKNQPMYGVPGRENDMVFYWSLSPEIITSFKDVFVLTYIHQGQSIYHFLNIHHIDYEFIGVKKDNGGYRFCDEINNAPSYVKDLSEKIHILDHKKLNDIGIKTTALSLSWFQNASQEKIKQLQNNIYNCFRNIWVDTLPQQRLWSTFNESRPKISGAGYIRRFLAFNTRATNEYRQCDHLVYAVNIYMNVSEKLYYKSHGIEVDEDLYALSIMIQWIWRSAIRDGKDIYIYIPSRRMRNLLIKWIQDVGKEVN